jgi:hypothetical protein
MPDLRSPVRHAAAPGAPSAGLAKPSAGPAKECRLAVVIVPSERVPRIPVSAIAPPVGELILDEWYGLHCEYFLG